MKIYKEGEKSRALCSHCKEVVPTTFKVRDVPFSSGKGQAKDILVAICDSCDKLVSVPQQSAPRIREQRKKLVRSIEARVPKHLYDMLLVSYDEMGIDSSDKVAPIVRYYINEYKMNFRKSDFAKIINSEHIKGKASERVSIKLSESLFVEFNKLKEKMGISTTDLIKTFMLRFYDDIIEKKQTARQMDKLKSIFIVAS